MLFKVGDLVQQIQMRFGYCKGRHFLMIIIGINEKNYYKALIVHNSFNESFVGRKLIVEINDFEKRYELATNKNSENDE